MHGDVLHVPSFVPAFVEGTSVNAVMQKEVDEREDDEGSPPRHLENRHGVPSSHSKVRPVVDDLPPSHKTVVGGRDWSGFCCEEAFSAYGRLMANWNSATLSKDAGTAWSRRQALVALERLE